jgi:signal transduction histidine kinase
MNAVKFTQTGFVKLSIEWDNQKSKAKFVVMDSGVGMCDNEVRSLFRPLGLKHIKYSIPQVAEL